MLGFVSLISLIAPGLLSTLRHVADLRGNVPAWMRRHHVGQRPTAGCEAGCRHGGALRLLVAWLCSGLLSSRRAPGFNQPNRYAAASPMSACGLFGFFGRE